MTIRFTISVCDLNTFAFVSPSVSVTPSLAMAIRLPFVTEHLLVRRAECPECSMSNILTSSVAEIIVRSAVYGMNLTENMLDRWPVRMEVVRLNCDVDDSGLYAWRLILWSSDPLASNLPEEDQLQRLSSQLCFSSFIWISITSAH